MLWYYFKILGMKLYLILVYHICTGYISRIIVEMCSNIKVNIDVDFASALRVVTEYAY